MRGRLIPGLPGQGSKGRVGTFTDLSPFDQYDQGPANHTDAITMCHVSSTIDRDVAVICTVMLWLSQSAHHFFGINKTSNATHPIHALQINYKLLPTSRT
ncbi:Uncharacterized protein HZ326_5676 [Fusarium oxysporum f. sp. albedinis]|nr:Uncharacterized protein HZ326_5676 [Fusarium oxysporum f. sp. albedinis]